MAKTRGEGYAPVSIEIDSPRMSRDKYAERDQDNHFWARIGRRRTSLVLIILFFAFVAAVFTKLPEARALVSLQEAPKIEETIVVVDPIYIELPLPAYGAVSNATDFYDRTAMLVPSYAPHRFYLRDFLKSMILLCVDHRLVHIRIIIDREDFEMFNEDVFSLPSIKAALPRLDWVFIQDEFPAVPQPDGTFLPLNSSDYDRYFYQSLKKAYGCASLGVDYCWVLDSESFFLRKITFRTMVGEFVRDPHLLVSTRKRMNDPWSVQTRKAMNITVIYPHTLEEYFWLFDNSVLKGVTAKLVDAVFSGRLPKGDLIWIDVAYFNTIMHSQRVDFPHSPFDNWRIIDTSDMYGNLTEYAITHTEDDGLYEGLLYVIMSSPGVTEQLAHQILALKWIRLIRCGWRDFGPKLLLLATNLVMCTSEHDAVMYEYAMTEPGFGPALELDGSLIL